MVMMTMTMMIIIITSTTLASEPLQNIYEDSKTTHFRADSQTYVSEFKIYLSINKIKINTKVGV